MGRRWTKSRAGETHQVVPNIATYTNNSTTLQRANSTPNRTVLTHTPSRIQVRAARTYIHAATIASVEVSAADALRTEGRGEAGLARTGAEQTLSPRGVGRVGTHTHASVGKAVERTSRQRPAGRSDEGRPSSARGAVQIGWPVAGQTLA